jgi:ABC-2 type transport system ATP-binding protein
MLVIDRVDKVFPGGIGGAGGARGTAGVRALSGFSLELGPGILGLLGPNGAGKSTLMRILATVTRPTAGRVLWQGEDVVRAPQALRRVLGYLPQDFGIYPNLSAREFLEYLAAVKGLAGRQARARIGELLELVNLTAAGRRPLGSYSGGMRQRVGIAQALLNEPRLLIVDEPTVGLDPEERMNFRGLLASMAGERLVILSTHIVTDVEATAGMIAIIDGGRLVTHATPEALLRTVEGRVWEWPVACAQAAAERGRRLVSGTTRRGDAVVLRVLAAEPPGAGAQPAAPALEDAYLHAIAAARAARAA